MFFKAPDQYILENTAFTIGDTHYPSNWLSHSTQEQKDALGLIEVMIEGQREDDRFYWVTENRNGAIISYTNTSKDLDELKSQWVKQVNQTAYSLLLPSDWMVVKALETSTAVPAAWTAFRASVRSTAANAVAAINACADVPALQVVVQITWPNNPDYVEVSNGS